VLRIEKDSDIILDRLIKRGRIAQRPISEFSATLNAEALGVKVSFRLIDKSGVAMLTLKRNYSQDVQSAQVIQTWMVEPIAVNAVLNYDDLDTNLRTHANVYYWLTASPLLSGADDVTVGPQALAVNIDQLPPDAIADFDASHSAASGGKVVVGVTFKVPTFKFGSCKIYIAGYQGVSGYVAIAQNSVNPFNFTVDQTGETVTLKAVAVSPSGKESEATAPTKSLTLGVAATVPAKVMNVTAQEISTGVQVGFPANPESNVTQYSIYRAARGAGFGAASSVGSVAPTGANAYTFLDSNGLTGKYEWFVYATNAVGNGTASDAATPTVVYNSGSIPVNVPSNQTNDCTIDSIDAGASATIRIYGPSGVGNGYTAYKGYGNESRPYSTITGKSYTTKYYIYYNGSTHLATTSLFSVLPDGYEQTGSVTTVAGGGGGGTSGGGGSSGSGCTEVGSSLSFPPGSRSRVRLVPCSDWIDIELRNGQKLSVARNTLVSVFKRAEDLVPGDLVEVENGQWSKVKQAARDNRESLKQVATVEPSHVYEANGIRLHNLKPNVN
jgi:hypothetical protein